MFIYTRDCGFCPYAPTSYAIFWVTGNALKLNPARPPAIENREGKIRDVNRVPWKEPPPRQASKPAPKTRNRAFRRVGFQMIVRISKFRGVGPHHGRNSRAPERPVVAAVQHGKQSLGMKENFQSDRRKLRNVGFRKSKRLLDVAIRFRIPDQTEKIGLFGQRNRQPRRDVLLFGTRKPDHFQNVRAGNPVAGIREIVHDEIGTSDQPVFFPVERREHDR